MGSLSSSRLGTLLLSMLSLEEVVGLFGNFMKGPTPAIETLGVVFLIGNGASVEDERVKLRTGLGGNTGRSGLGLKTSRSVGIRSKMLVEPLSVTGAALGVSMVGGRIVGLTNKEVVGLTVSEMDDLVGILKFLVGVKENLFEVGSMLMKVPGGKLLVVESLFLLMAVNGNRILPRVVVTSTSSSLGTRDLTGGSLVVNGKLLVLRGMTVG